MKRGQLLSQENYTNKIYKELMTTKGMSCSFYHGSEKLGKLTRGVQSL